MTDYSQYHEQEMILDFFKAQPQGLLWDIGAGDGIENSNTRALIEKGWSAVMFEPARETFSKLFKAYRTNPNVLVFNFAVGAKLQVVDFFYHPQIPGWSSADPAWVERFRPEAKVEKVLMVPIIEIGLMGLFTPDFLSIDTEGLDADIIETLPEWMRPKLLIAEIDKNGAKERINAAMLARGYAKVWETVGNAAYAA